MIEAFPASENERVYVLMDSWYTSEKVVNACSRKGFYVIATIKTNRLICPSGITIKINDFAEQYIQKSDLRSVTVEGVYWVYAYEGPVSEIENVRLLLSWKDDYTSPEQTRSLSPVYGSNAESRYDSTVLSRSLEYLDGVSLFQGTAGL
ncbi:MAG: hypothetical protein K0S39_333 [Paenibacillus sp.]|jgi:hypothetical protein|nr:hypothetical protein [Paenibacillus sp.]